MIPVVTADEMRRLEQGVDAVALSQAAGKTVASFVNQTRVALLVGKGNKGGDAFVAGCELLARGACVEALFAVPLAQCSELNRRFGEQFQQIGGVLRPLNHPWGDYDLLIDGLLGTGFRDTPEAPMAEAIVRANNSKLPILAIDVPSGLDPTTGVASAATIRATQTVTLGFPKSGLFFRDGWNYVGKLHVADIGLRACNAHAVAYVPNLSELELPPIVRTRHKYQRGFVVGFGGSTAMQGAPKLSGLAALHAGAGIVKLYSLDELGTLPNELIAHRFDEKLWTEALAKAQAVFVGPGVGRSAAAKAWCEAHMPHIRQPCVVDADALWFLHSLKTWPRSAVLTPHRGEMNRLLGAEKMDEDALLKRSQALVDERQVTLVLKGAPTFILAPRRLPTIIPRGDPGMATAGAGDVLTGVVAALLAQGKEPFDAAVLGVTLHALAGEAAARLHTSYAYAASDLIAALSEAFKELGASTS